MVGLLQRQRTDSELLKTDSSYPVTTHDDSQAMVIEY